MPLNVLGRTRTTLMRRTSAGTPAGLVLPLAPLRGGGRLAGPWGSCLDAGGESANPRRAGDWRLQLFATNEECLVCAGHQPAPIASLPFVHTARRCYRWCKDREPWRRQSHGTRPTWAGSTDGCV